MPKLKLNYKLILIVSILLFAFGYGFGFIAFPEMLREMIKSVWVIFDFKFDLSEFSILIHVNEMKGNALGKRFKNSAILREGACLPRFPHLLVQRDK